MCLESTDRELMTLGELYEKCESFSGTSSVYSEKWLKKKLKERYGDRIVFAEVQGRKNVICWHDMASFIINEKWYSDRKRNIDDDARRIVKTAAKLIRASIRENECYRNVIPRLCRSNNSVVIHNRGIPFLEYCSPAVSPLTTLSFVPWLHLQKPYVVSQSCNLDLLWHCGWLM